jgi:hypothetical protein
MQKPVQRQTQGPEQATASWSIKDKAQAEKGIPEAGPAKKKDITKAV